MYTELEEALNINNQELEVDDINPNFLSHPDVLDFFIQQDTIRDHLV
jgi:hypothetical protein